MAKFSKNNIKLKYGVKTFEETKRTYDWIEKAALKWGGENVQIKSEFLFDLGDITCSTEGIKEFIETVYGASDYRLTSFDIYIEDGSQRISLHYLHSLSIYTGSKVELENFLSILEKSDLDKKTETPQINYIENQTNIDNHNGGTIIQGNNNVVATNNSKVNLNGTRKESKLKKWLIAIGQNLLSNWIWYLLTIGITALIAYFATKG